MRRPLRSKPRGDADITWERSGDWRVAWATGAPRDALRGILPRLDELASQAIKSNRRRQVLRSELADGSRVYLKRDFGTRLLDRAVVWPRRSRVVQEFSNLCWVRALGLRAAEPLCVAERRDGVALREGVLVTREIPDPQRLGAPLDRGWLQPLARMVRRLHDAGGWHRDLHAGNALLSGGELVLVDLQKLRILPFPLPAALRVSDLSWPLRSEQDLQRVLAGYDRRDASFVRRLRRGMLRSQRRRLHSRGRRCVVSSSGFRRERVGEWRIFRRADVASEAVLEAIETSREADESRLQDFPGGPPPGHAPSPFRRGHGAREPGAPAKAAALLRAYHPVPWPWPSGGMQAWRAAHAALVRGVDTPTPLALVEQRFALRRRSWLLVRSEPLGPLDRERDGDAATRADEALARLCATGLVPRREGADPFGLRAGDPSPVLADPAALRLEWLWW